MPKKTPDEVAYAEALGELTKLLVKNGVDPESATEQATGWLRDMFHAGWRHVRPRVDPVPPRGEPADHDFAAAQAAAARRGIARAAAASSREAAL